MPRGTLTDSDHQLLALWAATCAEHVRYLFESMQPSDSRPGQAIAQARAWARGEITMTQTRVAPGHAMAAHELGAAACAIRAARAAANKSERDEAGRLECQWQRARLPSEIRDLVLDDQKLRNEICRFVFDC